MSRRQLGFVWMLLAALAFLAGCGGDPLPPGGAAAVEYWHRVLAQYPDLPARVQAIVDQQGDAVYRESIPASSRVLIYGEDQVVAVDAGRIDLVITDLDRDALQELLACWRRIPEQAAALGLATPFGLPPNRERRVIVLGSQGRIDIQGVDGYTKQTIQVLADEAAGQTAIDIHTFGPGGETALEELTRNYRAVRGPPRAAVRSGTISLPPPDAVSILVIGKLQTLNIDGPSGAAEQQISLAAYLNDHESPDGLAGVAAGAPLSDRLAWSTSDDESTSVAPVTAAEAAMPYTYQQPAAELAPSEAYRPVEFPNPVQPPAPIHLPPVIELPKPIDFHQGFRPQPFVMPPPPIQTRPVVTPRFR